MKTEFEQNVLDYWKLPNGNYIVKMEEDDQMMIVILKALYQRIWELLY